ncbi:ABC transporter substrate-binding protein [Desulfosoma caldarium]|uniref:ABC-type branched-subunit amino acid transport system substrate-binding protein n=1 Tax=Desulfosoma caldarium TaxID=610254 RepID=A0A3N1UR32_9BACT|nr:ABC transporter substrate-binding protein [Desulfosoma caldarium]ROQ93544.1 ABC-type branched-subunit amino acid transport system substrate-binding protein [Desulfosoma caldarium]
MTGRTWMEWERIRRRRRRRRILAVVVLLAVGVGWAVNWRLSTRDERSSVNRTDRAQSAINEKATAPGDKEGGEGKEPAAMGTDGAQSRLEAVAVLPLSGPFAAEGKALQRGMKTAMATSEEREMIALRFLDGWLSESAVRKALAQALERTSVGAVLVYLPVSKWQAVLARALERELLVIALNPGPENLLEKASVLSFLGTDEDAAKDTARLLASERLGSPVLLLTDGSPLGTRWAESLSAEADRLGLALTLMTWSDAASPLDLTQRPKTVFLAGAPHWAAEAIRVLELAQCHSLYVLPYILARPTLLESLGPLVEKVRFAVPMGGALEDETEGFEDAFRRKFWKNPDWMARVGYDAVRWVEQLFSEAPKDAGPNLSRKALFGTEGPMSFQGLVGALTVTEKGRVQRHMVFARWKDGSFEPTSQESHRVEHAAERHIAP